MKNVADERRGHFGSVATPDERLASLPRVRVVHVPTAGGLVDDPDVPVAVRRDVELLAGAGTRTVVILDLADARYAADTLLDMLLPLGAQVRSGRLGDVVLVVATAQESVATVAEMLAATYDLPLYVSRSLDDVTHARPVGRLTPTEVASLAQLGSLGGRVTVSRFAAATDLEQTAAGNRLNNLARRGYVQRVPRSRRDGDEYVSVAYFSGSTARNAAH